LEAGRKYSVLGVHPGRPWWRKPSFDKTLAQITSLNAQATAAGALSSGQIQLDARSVGTNQQQQNSGGGYQQPKQ